MIAREYNAQTLPYVDASDMDRSTAVAVSVLTDAGIVEGNPDRTFRPGTKLNRAEFVKIIMGTVPNPPDVASLRCFPDIAADAWYAPSVCQARAMGLVSGNAQMGVPPAQWLFVPTRDVNYVEALKILVLLYHVPTPTPETGQEWYAPYLAAAIDAGIDLPEAPTPDHKLTRGQMARLVVRFMAWSENEFDKLIAAEARVNDPTSTSSSSANSSAQSTSMSSRSNSQTSSVSSFIPSRYDTDEDRTVRNNIMLLGLESPVLGIANIRSSTQPALIKSFIVRLTQTVLSMESMNIYAADGAFLGTAFLDGTQPGNRQYVLPAEKLGLVIPNDGEFEFYARGNLKSQSSGGQSGEVAQIDRMGIAYVGVWNSQESTEYTDDTFYSLFETAAGTITDIVNAGAENGALISGPQVRIGSFKVSGRRAPQAQNLDLYLKSIDFTVNAAGGVTVTNPTLGFESAGTRHDCNISGSVITCSNLDSGLSTFETSDRTMTVYADVTITSNASNFGLQLTINEPGTPLQSGDVQWTDGTSNFQWVPTADWPVAEGTIYD